MLSRLEKTPSPNGSSSNMTTLKSQRDVAVCALCKQNKRIKKKDNLCDFKIKYQ